MSKLNRRILFTLASLFVSGSFGLGFMAAASADDTTPVNPANPVDPIELAKEKQLSAVYLESMQKEQGAQVITGGVIVRPIFVAPSKESPQLADTVVVSYHLADREGKLIEESLTADEMAVFPLNKLIKCWQHAIPMMTVGSLYKISCPSDTAYGDKGAGTDIKPGAALTFRVTLFSIKK